MSFTEQRNPFVFLYLYMGTLGRSAKMISGIYCIENKINGKRYVGQSNNIDRRRHEHMKLLKKGNHNNEYLQNSVNKYGINNFSFEVITYCDVEKLNELEVKYIHDYDTMDKLKGYNLRDGGDRTTLSLESREKISRTRKERIANGEIVVTGCKKSPEAIDKMRRSSAIRWSNAEEVERMSIIKSTIPIDVVRDIKLMLYNDYTVNDIASITLVGLDKVNHIYNLQSFKHVSPEYNKYLSIRGEVHRKRLIRLLLRMYRDGHTFQSIADNSSIHIRTAIRVIQDNKSEYDEAMRDRCLRYKDNKRSRMVMAMVANGISKVSIANKLCMSRNTINKITNRLKESGVL